jgi:hypothetical protein
VASHWTPPTEEQRDAVTQIARASGGALVRTVDGGAAEVLCAASGVSTRYRVAEDGTLTIVDLRPRDWHEPASIALGCAFLLIGFGGPLLMIGLHRNGAVGGNYDFLAALCICAGIVVLLSAMAVAPNAYKLLRAGEKWRDWEPVGWPEY